jgi:hypothetical protein
VGEFRDIVRRKDSGYIYIERDGRTLCCQFFGRSVLRMHVIEIIIYEENRKLVTPQRGSLPVELFKSKSAEKSPF